MNSRKLILPVLVALACLGACLAGAGTAAAVSAQKASKQAPAKPHRLHIDSVDVGTAAGPLVVRVRADVKTELRMTVNGRRVATQFETAGPRAQTIELRAADHLHAGRNKLRIRATRAGVVRTATRTVAVPSWALRADAGADHDTIVHLHTRVGTPVPLGAAGDGAQYRWHVVERPDGPKPALADRDQSEPVLRAKEPGTYVLQLTADPEGEGEPDSSDQVTVSVVPEDPPIGVPINTINGNGDITIAGQSYGGGSTGSAYVVLERTTRAVVASGGVLNDTAGIDKLNALADKYGSGDNYMKYMMIVSGRSGVPDLTLDAFAALMKKLGVALPSEENFLALKVGLPYSVIGIPGAPAGAATIRIPGGYADPVSGAIVGYLQKNQAIDAEGTPLYDYVSTEQPAFDTKAPGSDATTNKMTIGNQTYSATLPAGATAGLHLVVLESLSLRLLSNEALATNGLGNDRTTQAATAKKLATAIEKPGGPTVFLQTIGKPKAAGPEWEEIVKDLTRLGANPQLVNSLNGENEYALVTRNGAKAPPAEAGTASDAGPYPAPQFPPARLIGTLARSRTSNFVPNVYSTPTEANPQGSVNLELMKIAYQAPRAWPALAPGAPAGEADAAQKFLCQELKFCQPASSCPSLRDCFWQRYGADWDLKYAALGNVNYVAGKGFGEATFKAVKEELLKETEAVANVKAYLKALQEPFDRSATRSYVDLQAIGKKVWDSVQRPAADNSTSWILGLIGKAVALGGFAKPPISSAAAGLSAGFGLAAYLSNKQGQPILGAEIKARSEALGGELLDRIDLARKTTVGLGMLLVSDYGKLSAADQHVDSDWALPQNPDVATNILRTASRQWFYEALIPTAYPYLIRGNGNNARNLDCQLTDRRGWPNQPDVFQMYATVGYDTGGNPIKGIFFFSRGIGGAMSPPASLDDEMFRPREGKDPGLGMDKLRLFTARVFNGRIYHAVDHTPYCSVGFLPREW